MNLHKFKLQNFSLIESKFYNFTLLKFVSIIIGLFGVFFIIGFDNIKNFKDNESHFIPKFAIFDGDIFNLSILDDNFDKFNDLSLNILALSFNNFYAINALS